MESTTATESEVAMERLNVYMPVELRERLKRAAATRGTSENSTAVKLLGKGLDWYESLSDERKEAS